MKYEPRMRKTAWGHVRQVEGNQPRPHWRCQNCDPGGLIPSPTGAVADIKLAEAPNESLTICATCLRAIADEIDGGIKYPAQWFFMKRMRDGKRVFSWTPNDPNEPSTYQSGRPHISRIDGAVIATVYGPCGPKEWDHLAQEALKYAESLPVSVYR